MKKRILQLVCMTLAVTMLFAEEPAFKIQAGNLSSREENIEEANSLFIDFVGILLAGGWTINNLFCTFSDYPYSPEAPYVSFKIDTDKTYRFTLDSSLSYAYDAGITAQATFRGFLYKFFGPCLEIEGSTFPFDMGLNSNWTLSPANLVDDNPEFFGKTKLGGIFSIFQSQGASLAWYLQWLYDFSPEYSQKSGFAVGAVLDSYPVKPIGVHLRVDYQNLPGEYSLNQFDAQIGFLKGRWEFFCGYQLRTSFVSDEHSEPYSDGAAPTKVDDPSEPCDDMFCHGMTLGLRMHM